MVMPLAGGYGCATVELEELYPPIRVVECHLGFDCKNLNYKCLTIKLACISIYN